MYIDINQEVHEGKCRIRNIAYHCISVLFIIGALLFTFLRFGGVFHRTWEVLRDLGISFAYMVIKPFAPDLITPTVLNTSEAVFNMLPWTWEEFQECIKTFGIIFIDKRNFFDYISLVLTILTQASLAILPLAMIIAIKITHIQ